MNQKLKDVAQQFLASGKNLTLLNGKIPVVEEWTDKRLSKAKILKHTGNLGWVIGDGDLVMDVDPRNGGDESFERLQKDLDIELEPTVTTPSGGYHCYLKIPHKYRKYLLRKTINDEYPGIDFLTKGAQCVIPGSRVKKGEYVWYDDLLDCFGQDKAPKKLIKLLAYKNKLKAGELVVANDKHESDDDDPFAGYIGGSSNWSEEQVRDLLDRLDPSMDHDNWVRVGMGLHDWDPKEGVSLWEEWSKKGDNYEEGVTYMKWKSFKLGGGVSLGTVAHMAMTIDHEQEIREVNEVMARLRRCSEIELERDILKDIRAMELRRTSKEKLAVAIQGRFREISGIKMPIGHIRNMLTKPEVKKSSAMEQVAPKPKWCKDWMYVNNLAAFVELETLELYKSESFNIVNGGNVPYHDSGTKPSALKYVSDNNFIDHVQSMAYLPMFDKGVQVVDGTTVLNCFNPNSMPTEAEKFTAGGMAVIEMVKKHIEIILGSKSNAHIFTQWLAHQVQHPGEKILWSPVIQSIQGVGKSFFGELLRKCLGDRNVGTVNPSQVVSDFNPWASGVCVNVLEELRIKGHNRYEAVNALKPLITDRMIQVHRKGVDPYMTYNTCNYLCFTNHSDAIPMETDDRRWWIIFVKYRSLDELSEALGESHVTYFPRLFEAIREYPEEIKKWLMEYEITDEFMSIKQAPMTDDKKLMIASEELSFEGLVEAREMLEKGGPYYNLDAVSTTDFFDQLLFDYPDVTLDKYQKNRIMKKMGYKPLPKPVKVHGKARRIWVRNNMTNLEIRASFEGDDL